MSSHVFKGKLEKYQFFLVEKKALSRASEMH